MSRHRDFDAARAERAQDPLTFTLDGYTFTVQAEIPAGPLFDLAAKGDLDMGDPKTAAAAYRELGVFLRGVVVEPDRERFDQSMAEVGIETLFDLVQWIIEEATGRPLGVPSDSLEPASDSGEPSRVVSLSQVSETRSA